MSDRSDDRLVHVEPLKPRESVTGATFVAKPIDETATERVHDDAKEYKSAEDSRQRKKHSHPVTEDRSDRGQRHPDHEERDRVEQFAEVVAHLALQFLVGGVVRERMLALDRLERTGGASDGGEARRERVVPLGSRATGTEALESLNGGGVPGRGARFSVIVLRWIGGHR